MNGDLWDMWPSPGSMHGGGIVEVRQPLRAAGDTPTANLRVCVCYVSASLGDDKLASSGPRCHRRDDNNSNNNGNSIGNSQPAATPSENCTSLGSLPRRASPVGPLIKEPFQCSVK